MRGSIADLSSDEMDLIWQKYDLYRKADVAHLEHDQEAALRLVATLLRLKLPRAALDAIHAYNEATE